MFENGKTNAMDNYSAEKLLFILSSTYIFEKGSSLNLNTLRLWQHGTFSWLEFIDNRKESDLQNIDLNKTQKLLKVVHRVKKNQWCQRLSAVKTVLSTSAAKTSVMGQRRWSRFETSCSRNDQSTVNLCNFGVVDRRRKRISLKTDQDFLVSPKLKWFYHLHSIIWRVTSKINWKSEFLKNAQEAVF